MPRKPLDLSSGFKTCPKCQKTKPVAEFHKAKSTMHGYQVYCKTCQGVKYDEWRRKNLKKMAEDQKRRRQADPERFKDYGRKKIYGMERGEYDRMLAAQDKRCAICKSPDPRGRGSFHVDHCHEGGHVRGLLCHNCNIGIGNFQHDTAVLEAAIDYLSRTTPRKLTLIQSA